MKISEILQLLANKPYASLEHPALRQIKENLKQSIEYRKNIPSLQKTLAILENTGLHNHPLYIETQKRLGKIFDDYGITIELPDNTLSFTEIVSLFSNYFSCMNQKESEITLTINKEFLSMEVLKENPPPIFNLLLAMIQCIQLPNDKKFTRQSDILRCHAALYMLHKNNLLSVKNFHILISERSVEFFNTVVTLGISNILTQSNIDRIMVIGHDGEKFDDYTSILIALTEANALTQETFDAVLLNPNTLLAETFYYLARREHLTSDNVQRAVTISNHPDWDNILVTVNSRQAATPPIELLDKLPKKEAFPLYCAANFSFTLTPEIDRLLMILSKNTKIFSVILTALGCAQLITEKNLVGLINLCKEEKSRAIHIITSNLKIMTDHFEQTETPYHHWRLFLNQQLWDGLMTLAKQVSVLETHEIRSQLNIFFNMLEQRYQNYRVFRTIAEDAAELAATDTGQRRTAAERRQHELYGLFHRPEQLPEEDANADEDNQDNPRL